MTDELLPPAAAPLPPSGRQYELSAGDYRATIVEVGGGVRSCYRGNRPVIQPYALDAMCDGAHGAPLVPWPNRLADGRYTFDGRSHQVALTEPTKHNAIHGFLRWRSWQPVEHSADRIVMGACLHPLEGYPFTLDVRVDYTLSPEGLAVRTTATNTGDTACPYACGQHPYLSPGPGVIDDCLLQLDAQTRILTSLDRQLPTGRESVTDTPFDFRSSRPLGDLAIDHAFADLIRDRDGLAWARLHGPDGNTAQLWVDEGYRLIELYTGDTLSPERRRRGLGSEPMTGPPNAFQSGEDLIRLEPGESATSRWGVQLVPRGTSHKG